MILAFSSHYTRLSLGVDSTSMSKSFKRSPITSQILSKNTNEIVNPDMNETATKFQKIKSFYSSQKELTHIFNDWQFHQTNDSKRQYFL